jgi:hypothetical protein
MRREIRQRGRREAERTGVRVDKEGKTCKI